MADVSVALTCPDCGHQYEISERDCPALADYVEDAIDDAVTDAKSELRIEYEGTTPDFDIDERLLGDLACAIRAGDRAEAELLLDRLAEEVGGRAQHEVEVGRFRKNPLLNAAA